VIIRLLRWYQKCLLEISERNTSEIGKNEGEMDASTPPSHKFHNQHSHADCAKVVIYSFSANSLNTA
jgi:hypothetical protein